MKKATSIGIIRWAARIIGAMFVLFTLFIFIGEAFEGSHRPHTSSFNQYTIILFIFWGVGLAGLLLGWWKERIGGWVSLLGFIIFNILAAMNETSGSSYSYVLLLFFIPALLFLWYSWLKNRKTKHSGPV